MPSFPIIFHPRYDIQCSGEIRFPIQKYQQLKLLLESEGILKRKNLFVPSSITSSMVSRTHDPSYVNRVKNCTLSEKEKRKIGLPSIDKFCVRSFVSAGGTLLAAKLALKFGFAVNAAGGSHHAARFEGAGFCIFNDVAIAVNCLLDEGKIKNAIILDLDVHQGDGTASIFEMDERVYTVSIHCQKNFPVRKANSNLDKGLAAGITDKKYLDHLDHTLLDILNVPADLLVYNAGVDIHENDNLGFLKVSSAGIKLREKKVVNFAMKRGLPLIVTLGGGYQKNVANLANLHSMIFRDIYSR